MVKKLLMKLKRTRKEERKEQERLTQHYLAISQEKVQTQKGKLDAADDEVFKSFNEDEEEIARVKSAAEDAALLEAMGAITEEEDNVESLTDLNLSDEDIQKLSNKGIKNKDDLAELAVDELQEIIEISSDDASKMIMKAREHWFN